MWSHNRMHFKSSFWPRVHRACYCRQFAAKYMAMAQDNNNYWQIHPLRGNHLNREYTQQHGRQRRGIFLQVLNGPEWCLTWGASTYFGGRFTGFMLGPSHSFGMCSWGLVLPSLSYWTCNQATYLPTYDRQIW